MPRAIYPPAQNTGAPPANAFQKAYDYDSDGNLIYEGWAAPGVLASQPHWAICAYTYTGANVTGTTWADGNTEQDNTWDDRTRLTYL